jgi:hypothetical protein
MGEMTGNLRNVQWLTVSELAELWAPELKIPASTIAREMQIALYKLEIKYNYSDPINVNPADVDLPSLDTLVDREFIDSFHDKQIWKMPSFWFDARVAEPSFPGRPSLRSAIVQELRRRHETGEMLETIAAESRALSTWAENSFPGQQTPTPKTTENSIRTVYKTLRSQR